MLRKLKLSPALRVTLAAMLFSLVAIGTLLFAVYSMYWDALDVAAGHAEDMATLLSDDVANGVEAIDMALRDAVDIVATNTKGTSIAPDSVEELHKLLLSRRRALGSSEIVAVADDKGDVIAGSDDWVPAPINIADREYFTDLRSGSASGLVFSKPLFSRLDGAVKIFFARRIDQVDGQFLGVAFVGVKPAALFKHQTSLTAIGERSFSLFYADSTVAWREPEIPGVIGKRLPDAERWLKISGGWRRRLSFGRRRFDPQGKYIAVRQVPDLPLFVNVAVTDRAALKNWLRAPLRCSAAPSSVSL